MTNLQVENVNFREAIVADCMEVAAVHVQSWRGSFSGIVPQTFLDKMSVERRARAFEKRFADDTHKMHVAEVPGRGIVGFADFGEPRESIEEFETELYAIYLLPEFQRKGVGGVLFNQVVEALVRSGRNSMYLLALEVSPYRSFYEKMGGHVIGRKQIEIENVIYDALVFGWTGLI